MIDPSQYLNSHVLDPDVLMEPIRSGFGQGAIGGRPAQ